MYTVPPGVGLHEESKVPTREAELIGQPVGERTDQESRSADPPAPASVTAMEIESYYVCSEVAGQPIGLLQAR